MAKVTGPLHSLTASGSIGDTLTMLRQLSRNIAKRKSAPTGAPSGAQLARRALYAAAAASWSALTTEEKASYAPAAAAARLTPYNTYMRGALAATTPAGSSFWDAGASSWDGGLSAWD